MKANNGLGNIPERDEWETPKELFNILDDQYQFDFDCCARENNRKALYFSNDFLKWYDNNYFDRRRYKCWMNPPFSKASDMFKHFFKSVKHGVAIYRCDNFETKIWQDIIFPNCDWIFIPKGRVVYEGMNGNGSRFPSALIGVGVDTPIGLEGQAFKFSTIDDMKNARKHKDL